MSGGERSHIFAPLGRRRNHLHLLPVVRKLATTIEASDVGSSQRASLWAATCAANGYRKAVPRVPATKKNVNQFRYHWSTFHAWAIGPRCSECAAPFCSALQYTQFLRYVFLRNGFDFVVARPQASALRQQVVLWQAVTDRSPETRWHFFLRGPGRAVTTVTIA